jgi:hypothetical protein
VFWGINLVFILGHIFSNLEVGFGYIKCIGYKIAQLVLFFYVAFLYISIGFSVDKFLEWVIHLIQFFQPST